MINLKEKKPNENKIVSKLETARKATKSIGTIVMWVFYIFTFIMMIPAMFFIGKAASTIENAVSSMNTEKSFNLIGTMIDENGAIALAEAFERTAYSKGCDSDEIEFTIDYDGFDKSNEFEKKDENSTTIKTKANTNIAISNISNEFNDTTTTGENIFRDYSNMKDISDDFHLSFIRKSTGCYKNRGPNNE